METTTSFSPSAVDPFPCGGPSEGWGVFVVNDVAINVDMAIGRGGKSLEILEHGACWSVGVRVGGFGVRRAKRGE